MTFYSQHHSFDIALAARYGIECAILIHHFQHWIRINQVARRNIKEGRCWTYQTRKDIQAHFPYWTFHEVRRLCEKLVEYGILLKNNFNKSKVDKTLWYAFVNEEAFGVDEQSSKSFYERQNCPSKGKIASPGGKIATPIPDTKPDSINTDKKEKEKSATPPPSADASDLCKFFIEKIRERNPKFKEPKLEKWVKEFECILKIDQRDPKEIKALIEWIHTHSFWKANCLSPATLRKQFDRMIMQMQVAGEQKNVDENRYYAMEAKKTFPERLKNLTINARYAMNLPAGKEVPFSLPKETFRSAFVSMFGGQYEPNRRDESGDSMDGYESEN